MIDIRIDHYIHYEPSASGSWVEEQRGIFNELKGMIMASQEQLVADLAAMTAQVEKIGGETRSLISKVDELMAALAAASETTPAIDNALQALKDQLSVVDALVPDAPEA